jgi:hypothetical protein
MAYLKQRLETLLGHDVWLHVDTSKWATKGEMDPPRIGKLVEAGEDYVGVNEDKDLYLILIAHVIAIRHNSRTCLACP